MKKNTRRNQILAAVLMTAAGAALYAGAAFYQAPVSPKETVAVTAEEESEETEAVKETEGSMVRTVLKAEEDWEPSPDELNLAHFYPEATDTEDESESLAAMAFYALARQESSWWSNVYSCSSLTPRELAVQLGRDPSTVYSSSGEVTRFKSIHMNVVNGDGTPINLKSNIQAIMAMANVYTYYQGGAADYDLFLDYAKDLFTRSHSYSVSMGNVYYCDGSCQNSSVDSEEFDEDFFAFDTVFVTDDDELSHYDPLYEPIYETEAVEEETEAGSSGHVIIAGEALDSYQDYLIDTNDQGAAVAETYATFTGEDDEPAVERIETFSGDSQSETAETAAAPAEETEPETEARVRSRVVETQTQAEEEVPEAQPDNPAETFAYEPETLPYEPETAASEPETSPEAYALAQEAAGGDAEPSDEVLPQETSQIIVAGATHTTDESYVDTASEEEVWEEVEVFSSEIINAATSSDAEPADNEEASSSSSSRSRQTAKCPGHIDLTINIRIYELIGSNNLYTIDVTGNQTAETDNDSNDSEEEEPENTAPRWKGWGEEERAFVDRLCDQDWYALYGLSLSSFSFGNPLTPSEIRRYLEMLPEDLSDLRRSIIEFALESVGKVPYYWGGKPSHAGYDGNNFGMLISPDDSGRVLKGLDCSGWVNWVYWSVTGIRSPNESTGTLAGMGRAITLDQMQPGDIAVRTGSSAHVIMFLGFAEDGNILCIHESSAGVNNVTIAERQTVWPYYRNILD